MRCGYSPAIKALILNCTLKASPAHSNTSALAEVVGAKLREIGRPSSIAQRVLERMDATLSEQDDEGRPVAYNGPGEDYLDCETGHEWSHATGETAATNLLAAARALAANPIPAPPG